MKRPAIADRDLRIAADELAAGREMLRDAHAIVAAGERRAAIATAVGKLALASRQIDEVVDAYDEESR